MFLYLRCVNTIISSQQTEVWGAGDGIEKM